MPVSDVDCLPNRFADFARFALPCAQAEDRHLIIVREDQGLHAVTLLLIQMVKFRFDAAELFVAKFNRICRECYDKQWLQNLLIFSSMV
jgi:hypothetical protein